MLVEHPASFSWPLRRRHLQTRAKVIPSFVSPHRALDAALSNSGGVLVSIGSTEIWDTGFPIILLLEHSHPASQGNFFFGRGKPYTLFSKQFNVGFTGFTLLHTSLLLRLGLDKNRKRALFFSANPGAGTFSWLSWLSPLLHWCHCPELCCINDVVIPCLKSGRSCLDDPI